MPARSAWNPIILHTLGASPARNFHTALRFGVLFDPPLHLVPIACGILRAMDPLASLIHILQSACSGELAAGFAYRGHGKSVRSAEERERIRVIEGEEWHHREIVIGLLTRLGARPKPAREAVFWVIGKTIGALCHVGGWFIPMYGAGRLERWNIVEYENAARFAAASGHPEMIDCLLAMAEVEWEHERYFRERIEGHRMLRFFPLWSLPPAKETIRAVTHSS